jgi:outer membrane autotransporter protein
MAGGVMVKAADKHNVFAEAGYTKGNNIKQPWAATMGYRYNW